MGNSDILNILIKQIAQNDAGAFAKFYDLFYIKLYRFSSYFLKSDELCQEVVSDVFLSIWQTRARLPGIENV